MQARRKPGPKKQYNTPAKLWEGVQEYLTICKEEGDVFPDMAGMRRYLDLSKGALERMCYGDSKEAKAYRRVLEAAQDERESWLARRMATEPRSAQGCMNNLKQPQNGGYIDRPTDSGKVEIVINSAGVGGEAAFK